MVTKKKTSWRTLAASLSIAGAALTLLLFALRIHDPEADRGPLRVEGSLAPGGELVGVRVAAPGVSFGRRRLGSDGSGDDEADVVATATAEVLRVRVQGHVVSANSREAIFGVPLGIDGEASHEILGWSAGEGAFELETEPGAHLVETHGSSWATVVAAPLGEELPTEGLVLVAAPAMDLSGFVVRADGAGVADAEVRLEMPTELLGDLPGGAASAGLREYATRTSQRGYFELLGVPAVQGAVVAVSGEEFEPESFELPGLSSYDLTWIVDDAVEPQVVPASDEGPAVRGVVLRADGEAAGDARVRLGVLETVCDWQGAFTLPVEELVEGAPLYAWLPGTQPAFVSDFGTAIAQRAPDDQSAVELTLGGATVALRGRVVAADGTPCTSWIVSPLEASGTFPEFELPLHLEELVGGGSLPEATTDGEGYFELPGLLSRSYRLRVWDPETLAVVHTEAHATDVEDLVVEVPEDAWIEHVGGRVESVSGRPLAGAQIQLRIQRARTSGGAQYREGAAVIADEDGRFELARVPHRHAELVVSAETVDAQVESLDGLAELGDEELLLRVAEHSEFYVESASELLRGIELLDEAGDPIPLASSVGDERLLALRVELVEGRTALLTAPEGTWTLALYGADGSELERRTLVLAPGGQASVQWEPPSAPASPAPPEVAPETARASGPDSPGD